MSQPPTADEVIARIDKTAASGDYDTALAASRRFVAAQPQNAGAHLVLARTLEAIARHEEARKSLEDALFLLADRPTSVMVRRGLADTLRRMGRPDDSLGVVARGLEKHPGSLGLLAARATTLLETGRLDEADALLAEHFQAGNAPPEFAAILARLRDRQRRYAEGAAELLEYIDRVKPPPEIARVLHTRAGGLFEKAKDYDHAMEHYELGNADLANAFDPDRQEQLINQLIETCSREALAAAPRAGVDASRLILIVGMPRSGTSLAERVLASHPDVHAAGELTHLLWASRRLLGAKAAPIPDLNALTQESVDATAAWYLTEMDRLAEGKPRLTDKAPLNVMRLWLAPLILPGVKIVHCLRDPRDTCLSNYAQQFTTPLPAAGSLTNIGRFYRTYRRVADHWSRVLAEPPLSTPIFELRYEEFVADPEPVSRRLLDFAGLEWTDAVLRPHEAKVVTWTASRDQVTEPINTSAVSRHAPFGERLRPLLDALGEYAQGVDPTPTSK
ncbi:MAG: sulfotransferase [Phycisphaerales bacterium]